MLTLMIRTDKPEAELYLYDDDIVVAKNIWQAHRQLLETIQPACDGLFVKINKTLVDLQGIVVFVGGGSFTGLRIGVSYANALAAGLGIPVVSTEGDDWIQKGIVAIAHATPGDFVEPNYGRPATITKPLK